MCVFFFNKLAHKNKTLQKQKAPLTLKRVKQSKDPKMQKLCEAVVMKVTKWIRNADVEGCAMPLPKVSPGASVLKTASRVVAGTDQEKKRHQRDLMNVQSNRKHPISKSEVS